MVNTDLKPQRGQGNGARPLRSCLALGVERREDFIGALESEASAVFLDLGPARVETERGRARALAKSLLIEAQGRARPRPAIFIRVAPVESATIDGDLAALMNAAPDGVLLEEACGGASIQHLSAKLAVHEAEAGLRDGATQVLALAAQTPSAIFALGSFSGASSRLAGLVFDGEALRVAVRQDSAPPVREESQNPPAPLVLARSLLMFGAAAAGVDAIDQSYPDLACEAGLRSQCLAGRREGFGGKVALSLAQIATINEAFG